MLLTTTITLPFLAPYKKLSLSYNSSLQNWPLISVIQAALPAPWGFPQGHPLPGHLSRGWCSQSSSSSKGSLQLRGKGAPASRASPLVLLDSY